MILSPQQRGEEASDRIAMRDAATFPLYASAGLFGLYLFFKVRVCLAAGTWLSLRLCRSHYSLYSTVTHAQ